VIKLDIALLIQFVNFIILLILLNSILFRPIRRIMQQRKETIDGGHSRAKELEGAIEEKMARYQAQLQEAKLKGNQERAEMRQAAASEEMSVLGAAQDEASAHLQQIKNRVAAEAASAQKTLRNETEALAAQVAAKVLGRAI